MPGIWISHGTLLFDQLHGLIRAVSYADQHTSRLGYAAMHTRLAMHQDGPTIFDNR